MRYRFLVSLLLSAAFLTLLFSSMVLAQTATTGAIVGTVTDKSGAVLTRAEVELSNAETNQVIKVVTNDDGNYTFPSVLPGQYNISVTKAGFRKATVTAFKVEVAKSYPLNFGMEVGEVQQTVEVTATAGAELQTTDSTVGNVIPGKVMPFFPALTRQANELIRLQPLSTPDGAVAGSRQDQSTFLLDGIDVTNQSVGGLGTYMVLPIDSIEEFRVGVANPNASFGRGAGGQVSVISKRGSNAFHGVAYWYHQNDNLNAASWTNKRTIGQTETDPVRRAKLQEPELKDNRFGFNFGGPIYPWKDKLFFFLNYEGRRFPRTTSILRLVPNETLRQGILRFRDGTGSIVSYNLATASVCGAGTDASPATGVCDPRALGLSPTISALWQKLPAGNDPSSGDGLNTTGFRGNVGNPLNNDYYNARVDFNLTDRWRVDGAFRYFGEVNTGSNTVNITGGNPVSFEKLPVRDNMIVAGLTGQITSNLTGEFRFGWVRTRTATDRVRPDASAGILAIPGTESGLSDGQKFIALDLGARGGTGPATALLHEPVDVDTQVARKQANDNKNFQWNADLSWVRGNHTFQFGSHVRYLPTLHLRDDKVLGALGALVAQIDADLGGIIVLPAGARPPTCRPDDTTTPVNETTSRNCLPSADVQQWNRLFASTLGIVDNVSVLAVRDGSFKPLPFGELLEADTKLWAPEFYFQDVWRLRPSLTLTYGVNYGWQTPPTEKLGRQSIQVDGATLQEQTASSYLSAREAAAREGRIFNPPIAFLPIKDAKRDGVFDIDWNNLAPRVAVSWNPGSFGNKWLGYLFGDRKTVIRGGYSLIFDRQNTVQSVIVPTLGVAFAQTLNVTAPPCNLTGAGGRGCTPTSTNPAASGFRVGVDGRIPIPTVPQLSIPVSPYWGPNPANPSGAPILFPEILSFQVDPTIKVGENHAFDLTWQREFSKDMLLEVGYVGRYANKLPQSMSFGQVPYIHVDQASRQTFAQAYDAVARQLRGGTTAENVTPQPWFENQVPGGTRTLAGLETSNFINGNVNSIFLTIDRRRIQSGIQPFNNYLAQTLFLRSSVGSSNYNALFVTLRKRLSQGLLYTVNYTFSKSLDQLGAIQNAASVMPNSFDLDAEYGPSLFDITHQFNTSGLYELPFGKGKYFGTSNGLLNKLIGGWYVSGIFTARSGDALTVTQGANVWGGSLFLGFATGAIPTTNPKTFGNEVQSGVKGSNNIGINSDPATRGTGLNLFANPEQVFNSLRRVELSRDGRAGRANPFRGLSRWNLDMSLGKRTSIRENVNVTFSLDFFNAFNNVIFVNPGLSLTDSRGFGVITTQLVPADRVAGSRWIQFGLRFDF
ncbi:MAG: carboxypeptidase-like regulatory domain-containing protein [Acidobacteria bacterium]|nr:carboxypeptidase-like regulatory domain-containing protein [Acidobacteriota bacterium]